MTSLHIPIKPGWICAGCGRDYPCRTRQAQLLAEYDQAPMSLALLMGADFAEAANDMPDLLAGELHARFLGWIRPPR